jgi:hypothetical protein
MSTKKILSWLLLLFGEAIIIAAFILFRGNTPNEILVLNIVVTSFVFGIFYLNYAAPWIDLKEKTHKRVGALGIAWFVVWLYAIAAILFMFIANMYEFSFELQLIIHGGLLFFFLLGMWLAGHAADQVKEVYHIETENRSGILEMKKAMQNLINKINETADLPDIFVQRVKALEESLRFISPTENSEAHELEQSFVEITNEIKFALLDFSMNEEQIENNLKKIERIYQNRKNIYSN